ncbi:hypothetical protein [Pseudomonas sp. ERMR1:02]|uniref:hypothetical protein n=1 Tax=unclassified Pseudomonas TaxID=196821 RepID=UPI0035311B23
MTLPIKVRVIDWIATGWLTIADTTINNLYVFNFAAIGRTLRNQNDLIICVSSLFGRAPAAR